MALCDLRMTDHSQSRVVQLYKPSALESTDHVSVSGLDLSKDRQELLVSYESDQIYTFPVFPKSKSPGVSTMGQIEEVLSETSDDDTSASSASSSSGGRRMKPLNELASYGAHLNRFTFLKNARYAGPRDEYICTGSDSGHAWVYEKATGAVVSLWKADNSTCNGVVPHPSLPIFITYGIDSTAKLWRSTVPVNSDVDDSAIGRRQHYRKQTYKMTPTVRNWGEVRSVLEDLSDGEIGQTGVNPDDVPSTKVLLRGGRLSRSWGRDSSSSSRGVPRIGNDLHNLEDVLKENLFTCLRSYYYDDDDGDDDTPVVDVSSLRHRVSLMRLRHQADSLGLEWNLSKPWEMDSQETVATNNEKIKDAPEDYKVDPADLIPEYPSDWMPYDPRIVSTDPFDFCDYFNQEDYADFYGVHYRSLDERNFIGRKPAETSNVDDKSEEGSNESVNEIDGQACSTGDEMESGVSEDEQNDVTDDKMSSEDSDQGSSRDQNPVAEKPAKKILRETMETLKDSGNSALKAGNLDLAAHRYDKAIQYGALLFMKNPEKASEEWNPLLKTLIVTRLNMSLLLLKPQFNELQVASRQAQLAIKELEPFCDFTSRENNITLPETKDEILKLKVKAYFRLGSAQYEMGDFHSAVKSFKESVRNTKQLSDPNAKPEQLVVRRLAEAKRELAKQKKRQRKKFKMAFSSTTSSLAAVGSAGEPPPSPASSSSSSSDDEPEQSSPMGGVGTGGVGPCPTTDTASSASTAVVSNTKASPPRGNNTRNGNENAVNTAAST